MHAIKITVSYILAVLILVSSLCSCKGTEKETGENLGTEKQTAAESMTGTEKAVETEKESEKQNTKEGNALKQFDISYYWGPQGSYITNEEYVKAIAECGFTSVPIENSTLAQNKKALELFRKYGLSCSALWDTRIVECIRGNSGASQSRVDKMVKQVLEDYADYLDVIEGWWLWDEPSTARFKLLAKFVDAFRRLDPDRNTFIDLFPTYAKDSQLEADGYEDYLTTYIGMVAPTYISYDHYHFGKKKENKGYYKNLEYIRKYALENSLQAMQIVQLTAHAEYSDLSREQIEWEVNAALAYGMKRVAYFTYMVDRDLEINSGYFNGCINYKNEKQPHYFDVQAINKQIKPLGDELFGKTSVAVFHVRENTDEELESGCTEYEGYAPLGAVEGNNFIIGFFDDGSFMIVNKNWHSADEGINALTLIGFAGALEFFDTESASWKSADACGSISVCDGKYTLEFTGGGALLLRAAD